MQSLLLLDGVIQDGRYALRLLRRAPGFAIAAVLTLGLAIGANTAVFSIADAVLLKPLPYPEPDRLALVTRLQTDGGVPSESSSQNGATWEALRAHARTFDVAVYSTWTAGANVVAGTSASHVQQQRVGSGFFRVLGVAPVIGREFTPEEDRAGGPAAVILSHEAWHSMFGGAPSAVGAEVQLRGERATVVGVMPPGFRTGEQADLWTPLRPNTSGEGAGENYTVLARLRPGASWPGAAAELDRIGAEVPRGAEQTAAPLRLSVEPLQAALASDLRQPLLLLWAGVAIVLVVACVNLAGLLLARGSVRGREIATRMALGGSRAVVMRQVLVESAVVALLGGAAGVVLGYWGLTALQPLARDAFEIWRPVVMDERAVAVAAGLALAASLAFGMVPAWYATRIDVQAALAGGNSRGATAGVSAFRRGLVVAQVALGVVLLAGAGLLLRTFTHLRTLDPGFDPAGAIAASLSLEDARYRTGDRVRGMVDATLDRLSRTPGVESAAVVLGLPYERLLNLGFRPTTGPRSGEGRTVMTSATYVSGDLFAALRIPLRHGRTFSGRDLTASPPVAIVNEAFAREYFGGETAVGHRMRISGVEREIVGVVGDVQLRPGWGDFGPLAAMPLTYLPLAQAPDGLLRLVHGWFAPAFVVRSSLPRDETVAALRRALDTADPLLPFARVRSLDEVRGASLAPQRLLMVLLSGLALAAVALAAVGIHGLIATSVNERTREMGIRLALGAGTPRVVRSLMMPGLMMTGAGLAVGITAALVSARLLRSFVWGVSTADPLTFVSVAVLVLAIAAIASIVPARRILRLDPAATLRDG
jgi:predicted permease